jgi:hypothetical protein
VNKNLKVLTLRLMFKPLKLVSLTIKPRPKLKRYSLQRLNKQQLRKHLLMVPLPKLQRPDLKLKQLLGNNSLLRNKWLRFKQKPKLKQMHNNLPLRHQPLKSHLLRLLKKLQRRRSLSRRSQRLRKHLKSKNQHLKPLQKPPLLMELPLKLKSNLD